VPFPATPLGLGILRERLLVRRLKQRDERAFEELIRLYQHQVYNVVYRLLARPDEAEEVAQEVFMTVFKSIDSFRGDSRLSTWLYRIATNHAKNRLKYLGRRPPEGSRSLLGEEIEQELECAKPSPHCPSSHLIGPEAALADRQLEQIVQAGIAMLDAEQREVIVLRDLEELSYEEIAAIIGIPIGTVKSRLFRGRLALKEHMAKHFSER
jgi:RNA polymerase sigma-70 factor (ECF subfamily)